MPNIALIDVYLAYRDRILLNNVSLTLNEKTKAALTGVNGAGKTTLMRILAGQQNPDSGQYFCPAEWKIGYMSQAAPVDLSVSAYQDVERAYAEGFAIEEEIASLDEQRTPEALERRALLHDNLLRSGFYERQGLIDATLRGLGFSSTQFHLPLGQLSSGWRMRAALARILLRKVDFLLLDEPSNYLDIQASDWLLDWLKRYPGGYLLVSHDRHFLDETTKETYELFCGKVKRYVGSYTQYEKKRQQELEFLIEQKKQQDERRQQLQDFIDKFRSNTSKAALVQSRIKELAKMREIKLPENLHRVSFRIPEPPPCGERVVYLEGVHKQYDGRTIFSDLTFLVNKGEKVVLIGENGAGKSTLMRILSGCDKDFTGFMKLGSGVQVGYFSEETHEPLRAQTVLEEVENTAPMSMQVHIRDLLATFLFAGDDVYKPIGGLSGGEKARLLLLKIFLKPFNLLLLDEPTNHLDIATKDALLNALQTYTGTVIFVSHDRYFIEKLAQYVLHVKQAPRYYHGDYLYATEQIQKASTAIPKDNVCTKATVILQVSENQKQREEAKRKSAEQKRRQRKEEQLLQQIAVYEEQQKNLEAQLGAPEIYTCGEKVKEISDALKEIVVKVEDLYTQWENL